jgi:cystathionine beta-synthase
MSNIARKVHELAEEMVDFPPPVVRLLEVARKLPCDVTAWCEYLNPAGSLDDLVRIALLREAVASGVTPGTVVIMPAERGVGVAVARVAAQVGYPAVITVARPLDPAHEAALLSTGARIVHAAPDAAASAPGSYRGLAARLQAMLPDAYLIDGDVVDPELDAIAAVEIIEACGGAIDVLVLPADHPGLGRIAAAIKGESPTTTIVVADVCELGYASVGALPLSDAAAAMAGAAPRGGTIDRWVPCHPRHATATAHRLMSHEQLAVGPTSAAVVWVGLQLGRTMPAGSRLVVLLPDPLRDQSIRPRHVSSGRGKVGRSLAECRDVVHAAGCPGLVGLGALDDLAAAILLFERHHVSQLPVIDGGRVIGVLSRERMIDGLTRGDVAIATPVTNLMTRRFSTIGMEAGMPALLQVLERDDLAIVADADHHLIATITREGLIETLSRPPTH